MLTAADMSGDEAASTGALGETTYIIIGAAWQSRELIAFFDLLDAIFAREWNRPVGSRRRGGRAPRIRVRQEPGVQKVVNDPAPVGLWRNCYDEDWVRKQNPWTIRDPNIIDEDYNFTVNLSGGPIDGRTAKEIHDQIMHPTIEP